MFAIQGVRGVDSSLSHWTTPDAFAGTVYDPASQKPYMYEGNNSYAYADPSGFCPKQRTGRAAGRLSPAKAGSHCKRSCGAAQAVQHGRDRRKVPSAGPSVPHGDCSPAAKDGW